MTSQLQQVANTYLTRRSLWVVAALAVISAGIALAVSLIEPIEPIGGLAVVGVAAAVTGYALGLHAKSQFANPRARLFPAFNRPHLAILAAILVAWCGVCPLVVALAAHWSPLGALAASIAGTAAGIWAMHRPHLFTIAPALLVFLSFGTEPTIGFWVLPASTPVVGAARLAIFAIAWGSIAYWFRRLRALGEEDADYLNLLTLMQDGWRAQLAGKQAPCASGQTLVLGPWQSRLADAFHDPGTRAPATTIAARQRLVGVGPAVMPLWVRAAGPTAMFLGMVIVAALVGWGFSAALGLDVHKNQQMVGIITLMTAAAGGSWLQARRPYMSQELILPLRRQDYFNGLLATSARHASTIWLTTLAAIVTYVALLTPERFFPGYIAAATALSLGMHTCMFGMLVNNSRLRSGAVRLVVYLVVLFAAAAVLIVGDQHLPYPVPTAAEREQLEQRVQEKYFEYYDEIDKFMQPESKQEALAMIRGWLTPRSNHPPVKAYVPWTCAAILTIAGVAAFLDARKRWLNLELG